MGLSYRWRADFSNRRYSRGNGLGRCGMNKTILGIDPGMNGALSFYNGDELIIFDTPTFQRNKTKRIDCHSVHRILQENPAHYVWIEQVNAFGMGASSAYNFGWSCGVMEALVSAMQIPFSYVSPQVWKKAMGLTTKEKEDARMRATQLLPKHAHQWDLKKHADRAEASLIALYGSYQ